MPGVRHIVRLSTAVAVVADSYWQAQQACDAIKLSVDTDPRLNTEGLRNEFRNALDRGDEAVPFPVGDKDGEKIESQGLDEIRRQIAGADRSVEFEYEVPYLAHATMEPLCATALIGPGSCELWAPSQAGDSAIADIAKFTGLSEQDVRLNRTYLGGGFGRKNERDFLLEAVEIAQSVVGKPVMLVWSRQEDTRHDFYRPAYMVRTRCGIESSGKVKAIHSRIAGQALTTALPWRVPGRADASVADGLVSQIYKIPEKRIDFTEVDTPIRTGFWRSVSQSHNGYFSEAVIDDIAIYTGRDPLDLRLELASDDPRSLAVLKLAAEKANWGKTSGSGKGQGVSLTAGWESRCAQVVEVSVNGRELSVDRIICAFDCGIQIDPDNIIAQLQGGIIFGLSAALFGQITFENGAVVEQHFADYPVVTLTNCPDVEVHLVKSDNVMGGVGEAGVPGVASALTSAIFAAVGERPRRLPLVATGWEIKR